MNNHFILKNNPRIEFQLLDKGFNIIDSSSKNNSGFYAYADIQSIELNNAWFPRVSKWLRVFTWITNMGVPYFPDAESYKKSSLILHFNQSRIGIWLTDSTMTDNAKILKDTLQNRH